MTTLEKKEIIKKLIFERAYELIEKSEEYIGILFPKDADRSQIEDSALKIAIKEWHDNKPVFNKPSFL